MYAFLTWLSKAIANQFSNIQSGIWREEQIGDEESQLGHGHPF